MANFSNNAITDVGRTLLSHVQMGAVFTPTRIVMGSGFLPAGTTTRTIKDVVAPFISLTINKKKRSNDGTATFGGVFSNQSLVTDTYFRELALYAKAVYADGQEVAECLYSYGNAGSTADLLPAYSSGQPVERQIDLVVYIGNDAAVNLEIESGVYVTQEQLAEELEDVSRAYIKPMWEVTIPATGWEAEAPADADFPYSMVMTYEGVLDTHNAEVTVDKESIQVAAECGLCPTMETLHNKLKFWSQSIPSEPILCHMTLFGEGGLSGGGLETAGEGAAD